MSGGSARSAAGATDRTRSAARQAAIRARTGVRARRRGKALGFAFGVGPLLACVGSLVQDSIFAKNPITGFSFGLTYPNNYLALFAAAAPVLLLETLVAASFIIPVPVAKPVTESRVAEIFGGLRRFFTYRPLVFGAVAYLLVYSGGNAIMDNVSMYAQDVLKEASATTDRKSTRLNSSHVSESRMPSSA